MREKSALFHDKIQLPLAIVCFALCAFVLVTITQEFYRGTRVRQAHTRLDFLTSLVGLVARGKRRYGGYLVHLAVVLMFVGFAGGAYKQEAEGTLEKGQTIALGRYTVRYDGLERASDPGKQMTTATLTVFVKGTEYAVMHPAKWAYRHHEDEPPTTEVDIHKTAKEDLYLILNGYEGELANIKVVINPLVDWIWLGFVLLALGTGIAFLPDRAYALAGAAARDVPAKGAVAALLALALVGAPDRARAQNSEQPMKHEVVAERGYARSDLERKLFKEIVCQCGTCGRQVLSECSCSTAATMRRKIQSLIDQGKGYDGVIAYELATYPGQSALVVPIDVGFNRLAWALPYGVLLGAVALLVAVGRKWTRRAPALAAAPAPAPEAGDDEYESRLDDELDKLD
jgi:cytochrome c-type biogenesis protein CcmF